MSTLNSVAIIGGGTAGWLTAGILAADYASNSSKGLQIMVIEAPNIPTIGVGEGTWPTMRDTLRRIGISEKLFLQKCCASFKQGSQFHGWLNGDSEDAYLHPFDALPNEDDIDVLSLWRGSGEARFDKAVSVQTHVCNASLAPKQIQTPEYAAVTNYAYHLDAGAFAQLLKEHCIKKLGVDLVIDEVTGVQRDENGAVISVQTEKNGNLVADLFVDCTGQKALLIGQELGEQLIDVSNVLFNDRALALQLPHEKGCSIVSQTLATAMPSGWVWDIALQSRRGVGFVYSSRFASEEEAMKEFAQYLKVQGKGVVRVEDARSIHFQSGYRRNPWKQNVVAIGMSQGFVEPLEASAIVMIELSAVLLSKLLPHDKSMMQSAASVFNERFNYRWERILDFLKLHYVLSKRNEPYWAAHRDKASWTNRLIELVSRWEFRAPSREDFPQAQEIFTASSYAFVLYGMGFETKTSELGKQTSDNRRVTAWLKHSKEKKEKLLSGLVSNRELLEQLARDATV